jgi:hypothetical protein
MRRSGPFGNRWAFLLSGIVIPAFLVTLSLRAEDSSPTAAPPAIYKEKLAKLLTPLDEVLKKGHDYGHT